MAKSTKNPVEDIFEDKKKPAQKQAALKRAAPQAATPAVSGPAATGQLSSRSRGVLMFISIGAIIIIIGGALWYATREGVLINSAKTDEALENGSLSDTPVDQEKVTTAGVFVEADFPADADKDGLTDEEETKLGTKLNMADSDFDNLFDREEIMVYKTDPLKKDTDGDGNDDGQEVANGYNPNGPGPLYDLQKELNKQN